jgi:DNA-binding Xre family transcriptional regulator
MNISKNNIDTGKLLHDFMQKNKIVKTQLGKEINRNPLSILNYTKNISIQTGILIEICHALKHNFFRDIADQLPNDFTRTKPDDLTLINEKDQLIAELKEENKILKIQNELLMKIRT